MRQAKIILYPIFGVYQFYLATVERPWSVLCVPLGLALIGLAILNLLQLTKPK